ncbi:MAG: 2-succinyl-5-enolpyruvyl-6-hydroxy-3-cyclohexene-1-carboxylic-acid synthase [Anaerolineae bacterium]|nr:2-succinyl-5-enolpyruvyl-6-hydroxy-3-cyclohexene-1-carboxylic-acid synthase [Anaerolineae bacterium]
MNREPRTQNPQPRTTIHAPNRNYVWTYTFVDELARAGLRDVVIAPGSRSTPLTMAFARHPAIRVWSHIDERGAAFMALGLGLVHDAPAAVVCSSGTAAANFYPAVVEAHYAHVPLLVLTADRPHELRDSGANQTVDQVKLYGDHVLWAYDVALPEANPPEVALRNLRTLADRAYALANGLPKGAVHLNFPFRKPLEPTEVNGEGREIEWWMPSPQTPMNTGVGAHHDAPLPTADHPAPHTQIERSVMMPTREQMNRLKKLFKRSERVLIVCGPRTPWGEFGGMVDNLAMGGAILFADGQASPHYYPDQSNVIADYDFFLPMARQWPHPQVVLHFGAMPTSQTLLDYLNAIQPEHRIVISGDGSWTDFEHRIDWFIQADPVVVVEQILKVWYTNRRRDVAWYDLFASADMTSERVFNRAVNEVGWFDGAAVSDTVTLLETGNVFVANSLAVRHLDQFGFAHLKKDFRVFCNRGASGIDGTISSALGVAAADPDTPTVLITGDLAFYHDMNALLAAKRNGIRNLVIVLLNNNGGQIFRRLPINNEAFEPEFTDLFLTPHGMTFEHTAAQFDFDYAQARDRDGFRAAFGAALARGRSSIVEVITDAEEDARRRKAIMDQVAEALKNLDPPMKDQAEH